MHPRKALLVVVPIVVVLFAVAAWGYLTATGSGAASANVGSLTAPGQPTRTGSGSTVALSWTASTVTGGGTIGYHVERTPDPGSTWSDACGTTVGSPTTSTSCTDSPAAGTYRYRVTALFRSWTAVSPESAAFVVAASDTTPPTSSITSPSASFYNTSGWNAGCSTPSTGDICGTASDAGVGATGVNKVQVSIRRGSDNKYWNGSTFVSGPFWNDATGTTTWTYALDASNLTDGVSYTVQSQAIDNASNTQTTPDSKTFTYDTTAPSNSLSLTAQSPAGSSFKSGSTVYYRGTGGGSGGNFRIRNAVSDSGSGPASSMTAALGGTTSGWTHAQSSVSTPAGGPYDSNTFTWTEGASTSPTEVVTAADVAGNTTAAPALTFTNDSTAPTGGVLTVSGQSASGAGTSGYSSSTGFAIGTRTDYTDAGSGIASSVLTVQSFALSSSDGIVGGACGAASAPFSSPTTIMGTTQPVGIVTGRCYTYTLTGTDNVGNTASVSTTVKVDTSAPSAPALTLSASTGNTFINGTTVFISAQAGKSGSFSASATTTDGDSGILNVIFPALTGFTGGGGTDTTSPFSSGTYSWSGAVAASGAQTVTSTNNAGLTANSSFTVTSDTAAPTGGSVTYSNAYFTTLSVPITTSNGSDGTGSGVDATSGIIKRDQVALSSGGSCGTFPGTFATTVTLVGGADTSVVSGNCYKYEYLVSDNVGNQATFTNTNVAKIDTTPPTVTAAIASTITSTAGYLKQSGTYFIYANVADPTPGSDVNTGTITANVNNVSGGTGGVCKDLSNVTIACTAVPLSSSGGPFTVQKDDGTTTSYTYRSTQQTANTTLSEGPKSFTATANDNAGNSGTTGTGSSPAASVTIDNTAPTVSSIASVNNGSTVGLAEAGDTVTLTFSEKMALPTSSSSNVTISAPNSNGAAVTLTMTDFFAAGFVIGIEPNYIIKNNTATFTGSGLARGTPLTNIAVTLAACSGNCNKLTGSEPAGGQSVTFSPAATLTDLAGNGATGPTTFTIRFF